MGERLKNLSGDTVWVQQKLPRPGPTPVYNLEVQDEHVYYVGASGLLAHDTDIGCTKVDPSSIRFTQSSVGNTIGTPNGPRPLRKLVKDLVGDRISADDLPPIRVFEKDGLMFTLDNRRLKAFQVAGKLINTVPATAEEVAKESWKFTTRNKGIRAKVRRGGL